MSDSASDSVKVPTPQTSSPFTKTSERFSSSDADVTFRSYDGVVFRIHRKNLETNTGAFPPSEFDTRDEVVPLTENSATLEILFQFIYPQRHPNLHDLGIQLLAPLSEAAEKYEVYSALNTCHDRMAKFVTSNPQEVVLYPAFHGHYGLIDEAAPRLVVTREPEEVLRWLPPNLHSSWFRYSRQWDQALISALAYQHTSWGNCFTWSGTTSQFVSRRLGEGVKSLGSLNQIFDIRNRGCTCSYCVPMWDSWKDKCLEKINGVPKFSTFC